MSGKESKKNVSVWRWFFAPETIPLPEPPTREEFAALHMAPAEETKEADYERELDRVKVLHQKRKAFHDETSKTIRRVFYSLIGTCLFCVVTLAGSQDIQLLTPQAAVTLPVLNYDVSFAAFLTVGPTIIIALTFYLHLFVEQHRSLEILPEDRIPMLLNFSGLASRLAVLIIFYWMVPVTLAVFAWKAWPRPIGPHLIYVALGATTALVLLQVRRCPRAWRFRALSLLTAAYFLSVFVTADIISERRLNLFKADLQKQDLRSVNLWAAFLREADLSGANLSGAILRVADLIGADLNETDLSRADLSFADLSGADLSGAKLGAGNLMSTAILHGANLHGAKLSGAFLTGGNLSRADLSGADLSGANLRGANLSRADLSGADLSGAYFGWGDDLSAADLSGADLSSADLSGADLTDAKLSVADLSGADLSSADLSLTDLSGATLRGANLRDAILSEADLSSARLYGVDLSKATGLNQNQNLLGETCGDKTTILPEGLKTGSCYWNPENEDYVRR